MPSSTPRATAWIEHLRAYRGSHPTLSLKECMQNASKTYRGKPANRGKPAKQPSSRTVKSAITTPRTTAWTEHLKAYRGSHPALSLKECMQKASKTYRARHPEKSSSYRSLQDLPTELLQEVRSHATCEDWLNLCLTAKGQCPDMSIQAKTYDNTNQSRKLFDHVAKCFLKRANSTLQEIWKRYPDGELIPSYIVEDKKRDALIGETYQITMKSAPSLIEQYGVAPPKDVTIVRNDSQARKWQVSEPALFGDPGMKLHYILEYDEFDFTKHVHFIKELSFHTINISGDEDKVLALSDEMQSMVKSIYQCVGVLLGIGGVKLSKQFGGDYGVEFDSISKLNIQDLKKMLASVPIFQNRDSIDPPNQEPDDLEWLLTPTNSIDAWNPGSLVVHLNRRSKRSKSEKEASERSKRRSD